MTLRQYLEEKGYTLVPASYYTCIRRWQQWYRGKVASFHNYTIVNSGKRKRRTRASLNMAKQGCETWANLLWNYECDITVDKDERADKLVGDVLKANNFWEQTNRLTEKAFALGTGAYVLYDNNGKTLIDYVTADHIFPLTHRNGIIESCAFAAGYASGRDQLIYLMIHEKQEDGSYKIINQFFKQHPHCDQISEVPIPKGIKPEYTAKRKRFAILTPNIANNIAEVPLGISVYGNYIDTLKNIDLAFDGIKVSMEVGRPRMGVSNTMMQVDIEPEGTDLIERFDPNDIGIYDMGMGPNDLPVEVKDLTVPYRATDFEGSLQTQLNIFSQNIGLGDKAFKWERGKVETAKQVISDDSAMLRTMEKHQEAMRTAVTDVALAILDINNATTSGTITAIFDDSVTRDKDAERQRAWQWVSLGKMAFWRYLVLYEGFEAKDAKRFEQEAGDRLELPPDDDPRRKGNKHAVA